MLSQKARSGAASLLNGMVGVSAVSTHGTALITSTEAGEQTLYRWHEEHRNTGWFYCGAYRGGVPAHLVDPGALTWRSVVELLQDWGLS